MPSKMNQNSVPCSQTKSEFVTPASLFTNEDARTMARLMSDGGLHRSYNGDVFNVRTTYSDFSTTNFSDSLHNHLFNSDFSKTNFSDKLQKH